MIDTYSDEHGLLDFKRSQHGSGMSSRSQAKRFISILQKVAERNRNAIFSAQEMRQISKEANIQIKYFEAFLESLNNQGYILKKGPRMYHLQTVDY